MMKEGIVFNVPIFRTNQGVGKVNYTQDSGIRLSNSFSLMASTLRSGAGRSEADALRPMAAAGVVLRAPHVHDAPGPLQA